MLRDDIQLATPPSHPTEPVIVNTNPLSTAPHPIAAGTRMSLVDTRGRESGLRAVVPAAAADDPSQDEADTDEAASSTGSHVPEKFGNGNASLATAVGGKATKKKPKTNIVKSNSSFVSRIFTHDNLSKRLAERKPEDLMLLANVNRAFLWLDMESTIKVRFLSG